MYRAIPSAVVRFRFLVAFCFLTALIGLIQRGDLRPSRINLLRLDSECYFDLVV